MPRLIIILGCGYAVSLIALLAFGVVPGVPWSILVGFVFHIIPLALTVVAALRFIEKRARSAGGESSPRASLRVLGVPWLCVALGLGLVYFLNWTAHPAAIVALALVAVWQLVAGAARPHLKPLGLSIVILLLGYGTVWNVNYLAGKLLPDDALCDQALLNFDIALYRDWLGHDAGGSSGLFPVVRHPAALRFLEHGYMLYYDEIFIVLFALLYTGADLARFFGVMFGCFVIGIPIFLLYPTVGPFTFAPESVMPAWHGSSTYTLMKGVLEDWQALRAGGSLHGYGYFIAMPSMHVAVALVLQVFAWNHRPVFWLLLPINVLLMLSTFLLGWHYILDVPAGLAVAGVTLCVSQTLRSRSRKPLKIDNCQLKIAN